MPASEPFNRLIFRAVLRNVSPMVIRVLAVPDYLDLRAFDEVFRTILGWDGIGFIFRVHGQEYNSFRRRTRSKHCGISYCARRRSSSTHPEQLICGSGKSGFSTATKALTATTPRFASAAAARLRRSTAEAQPATG